MKIALYNLTTTTQSGGIETFNREMARALAKKGHTVHIYGGESPADYAVAGEVTTYRYPYVRRERVPNLGSRFRKFVERLSFGMNAYGDLVERGYDYLYVSKSFDLPVALLASRSLKAKVIFGSGGTEFFPGYGYLVKKVDHFFACSGFNALQIEQYCGIRPAVLPNGVNTALFRPAEADRALRVKLGVRDSEQVIVSACRLVGWKGIQYAIRAVARLLKEGHDIRYLIIGDGEFKGELETLARSLGADGRTHFLGSVKNANLPSYYSIATAAVFPSIGVETFGIAIAEAMSCGVPVVSTRVGGIPEVVAEGTGFLVPPRDEEGLSAALKTLLSRSDLRQKMGVEGRMRIVENFSWDVIVESLEAALTRKERASGTT